MATVAKPEVFYVIGSLNVGGAEVHISMIARELVKRGFPITVYNLSGVGPLEQDMVDAGVRVIGPPFRTKSAGLKFLNPIILGFSSLKLFGLFLFTRPKIVHFFLPHAYIIGAVMARCTRLPRLVMSRRSQNYYQNQYPLLGRIERHLHRSMKVILGNSRSVVEQLRFDERVPVEKLGLIYNGVKPNGHFGPHDRERIRSKLGIAPETRVLVIVANLIPYKGHADLLDGLGSIRDEIKGEWTLLIVGRDDGIGDDLKQRASSHQLENNVQFLGARRDVPELLHISDIGILCSHEEGFSNVILEGMAASLPMVVTNVGGNAEAVQDGVSGLVVATQSPPSLATAILQLLTDRELADRMGAAGRRRVEEKFTLETCVGKYDDLYCALAIDQAVDHLLDAGQGERPSEPGRATFNQPLD